MLNLVRHRHRSNEVRGTDIHEEEVEVEEMVRVIRVNLELLEQSIRDSLIFRSIPHIDSLLYPLQLPLLLLFPSLLHL